MNSLKRICFSILLFPVVFLAAGILFIFTGYSDYQDYKIAHDVTAIITKCEYDVDTTGDTPDWHYDIYISYSFEGNKYSDIYWKSQNNSMNIGETVSVKVSPNIPEKPFVENPLSLSLWGIPFALAGIILSFKLIPVSFSGKENFVNESKFSPKSKKSPIVCFYPYRTRRHFFDFGFDILSLVPHWNNLFYIFYRCSFGASCSMIFLRPKTAQ